MGGSPTTVVNAALLIGVVANFAAAWWAGWTLRRSHLAGAVMGVVYALGPLPSFFMLHVHMTWRMGLPLAVVGIWRLLDQDDGERPDILGCLALASAALVSIGTSVYQAGFLALTVVVVLAVRHRNLSWRRFGAVVGSWPWVRFHVYPSHWRTCGC